MTTPLRDLIATLTQLARDMGTVQGVAERRIVSFDSEREQREHKDMCNRLGEWRAKLHATTCGLQALLDQPAEAIPPTPSSGEHIRDSRIANEDAAIELGRQMAGAAYQAGCRAGQAVSDLQGPAGGAQENAMLQFSESTGTSSTTKKLRRLAQWIGSDQFRLWQFDSNMDRCIVDPFTNAERTDIARLLNQLAAAGDGGSRPTADLREAFKAGFAAHPADTTKPWKWDFSLKDTSAEDLEPSAWHEWTNTRLANPASDAAEERP